MKFRVDFMSIPLPIRKARFKQFQELAFSKGIIWNSGASRAYSVTRLRTVFHPGMVMVSDSHNIIPRMYNSTNKDIPVINIKEAFKQLKEYKPSETAKIDQRTVQSLDATATTASYIVPTSEFSTVIGTTVRGF